MRVLVLGLAFVVADAIVFLACSSIPDVRFANEADAADAADGASPEAAARDGSFACPENPPPASAGECCNDRLLCLRCVSSDCNECRRENCLSDQVCCKGAGGVVRCTAPGACQ